MEDDNEITNYWSKLLLFLIIVFFGYITYYKFMVYDKRDVNANNKVKETEKSNENAVEPGIDDVHYADDTGEDINIDENNTEENNENIVEQNTNIDTKAKELLKNDVEILSNISANAYETEKVSKGYIYSNKSIKNSDIEESDKLMGIIFTYYTFPGEEMDDKQIISANKIKDKYKELFGLEVTFKLTPDNAKFEDFAKYSNYNREGHTCSYTIDDTFNCRATGEGTIIDEAITYIHKYEKLENEYYVYLSAARLSNGHYYDYNTSKEYILKDNETFKMDETNYEGFNQYKYTFELNEDGQTFKFVNLDSIK